MSESNGGIWLLLISFLLLTFVGINVFLTMKDQSEHEQALKEGIETEAFVIDKEKKTTTTMVSTGQVMIPNTTVHYRLKLYALKNEYKISVSKKLYDQVEQGDYLAAKVYKDRIILLQEEKSEGK
ncbi:DUF2500 family protein [Siminovitchia terrae]|uniref:DUF2500 family protein n=1 Tax=Siminovitchia terrae TaxID=1914933 RepID=A0A429X9Z6_SIMTE|nr:DUF2500 family protein [Siminovitchia terrae]RST60182.1 DUF2500 family protein [Siminovitchia terrae]